MSRCNWALITSTMGTRCFKEEGHIYDVNRSTHVGRSWEVVPLLTPGGQKEIRWLAGDPREQMTSRTDDYAWEIKSEAPFDWEDIPGVADG